MGGTSGSYAQLQLVTKKRHPVCKTLNSFTQWEYRRMSAMSAVIQEYRALGYVGGLQASCHFSCMKGVTVLVCISRNNHCRWIDLTFAHMVIRGVANKRCKVIRIVSGPELLLPDMCVIEKVVPKHVEHWSHTNHSPEKVWPLRHGRSDKQARIRSAEDG
jgi:hypothetical protein